MKLGPPHFPRPVPNSVFRCLGSSATSFSAAGDLSEVKRVEEELQSWQGWTQKMLGEKMKLLVVGYGYGRIWLVSILIDVWRLSTCA